jgi:hypothetical protein
MLLVAVLRRKAREKKGRGKEAIVTPVDVTHTLTTRSTPHTTLSLALFARPAPYALLSSTPSPIRFTPRGTTLTPLLISSQVRPYAPRNRLTGLAILTFVAGVYGYTMFAVKQEDYSEIRPQLPTHGQVPTLEVRRNDGRPLLCSNVSTICKHSRGKRAIFFILPPQTLTHIPRLPRSQKKP